jgi:hypothetical protein
MREGGSRISHVLNPGYKLQFPPSGRDSPVTSF